MADVSDVASIADQAYKQAEKEHELNCTVMDDHQSHIERAIGLMMPVKMANTMTSIVEKYFDKANQQSWDLGHHAREGGAAATPPTGDNLEGSPSSRGESSLARRLLGPLAAAAAGGGIALAANHYINKPPEPVELGPGSTYQYLEDQGYHVPPAVDG
jgi:hypothetical protein